MFHGDSVSSHAVIQVEVYVILYFVTNGMNPAVL
jgi:hypothetical protein